MDLFAGLFASILLEESVFHLLNMAILLSHRRLLPQPLGNHILQSLKVKVESLTFFCLFRELCLLYVTPNLLVRGTSNGHNIYTIGTPKSNP